MRNIGGADAALGADHRDDAPQRFRVRSVVEMRDVLNVGQHLERRHDIIADAARGQHAIERDVVLVADDDDLGAGVAIFRQVVETGDQAGAVGDRLDDDEIGRRRAAEGLDRGGDAAHVDLHVRLQHPAVHRGAFDDLGDARGLAKGLDRNARHLCDLGEIARGADLLDDRIAHQLPPVACALAAQPVPGSPPVRTF